MNAKYSSTLAPPRSVAADLFLYSMYTTSLRDLSSDTQCCTTHLPRVQTFATQRTRNDQITTRNFTRRQGAGKH